MALSCNILLSSYRSSTLAWPISFVKLFIEDFTQERIWSDLNSQLTKDFVSNIISSFRTELVPGFAESFNSASQRSGIFVSGSNATSALKSEAKASPIGSPVPFLLSQSSADGKNSDRYPGMKDLLCKLVIDASNEIFAKGKPGSAPCSLSTNQIDLQQRNVVQLLAVTCGLPKVRSLACSKLEAWLHNTKLCRASQDLLNSVCLNCSTEASLKEDSSENEEVVGTLIRIKPKNKSVATSLTNALREMGERNVEVNKVLIRNIVFNEFSGSGRNPNNMLVVSQLFQSNSLLVTTHLAYAFQLVLYQKEDFTKAVRSLFRDMIKIHRLEIKFDQFCPQLLDVQPEVQKKMDSEILSLPKYLVSLADLATYSLYLCLPMSTRELFASKTKKEDKEFSLVIDETQKTVGQIISHFAEWTKAHSSYFTQEQYTQLLQKMLLFEPLENYMRQDPYPPDQAVCHKLLIESGVKESCLFNIIQMGVDPACPLVALAAMNCIEGLVTRSPLNSIVITRDEEFIDQLFNLAVYSKPASISLPANYEEPKLAVSSLFWKAWTVLLVLSGSNVDTIANVGWKKLPMLKMLMEMCLTSDFNYPPNASNANRDDLRRNELKLAERERNEIITFECHLARKTITAESSLLISQLMFMDPKGSTRVPSPDYLTHLKLICISLKIGAALCSSRKNDYLLDILKRNRTLMGSGTSWLSQIIMNSEVDSLPPQCLCEFLLMELSIDVQGSDCIGSKIEDVKSHLRNSILDSSQAGGEYSGNVFAYLLSALSSSDDLSRKESAGRLIQQLLSVALKTEVIPEHLFEQLSKLSYLKQNILTEYDLTELALQTLAKEFDLKLIASALKFIVSQIAMQHVNKISFLTSFCDVIVYRIKTIEKCLEYCNELKAVFPSCCRILFSLFANESENDPIAASIDIKVGRGTKFIAPSNVTTCLFTLFLMSSECSESLQIFPLRDLSFEVVKNILPESVLVRCALRCADLFLKWVDQMVDITSLVRVFTFYGIDTSITKAVIKRVESYSLSGIKDALRSVDAESFDPDVVSNFGPKLECAYTSVSESIGKLRNQAVAEIVQEIDELDVDMHDDCSDDPLFPKDCKDVQSLAMLITQIMVKHPGQNSSLAQISQVSCDYSDLSEALVEVLSVQDVVASMVENVSVHELTAFIMQIGKNLGFRQLTKFQNELTKCLAKTKFYRSLKMLSIYVQNEETSMQPKSPEPEEKLSLGSQSLLNHAASKTGELTKKEFSCTGKVLDLVQISDPEIIKRHEDYLWSILFSGKHNFSAYHCFLTANLIHNVSWESLQTTVEKLLTNLDKMETPVNPTVILDFLTSVEMQPKLYQGRETRLLNKVSCHVFSMGIEAVSKLLILAYQECSECSKADKSYQDLLQSRIVLLLKLLRTQKCPDNVTNLIGICDSFKNERIRKCMQMLIYLNTAVPLPSLREKFSVGKADKFQNSFEMDILAYNLVLPFDSLTNLDYDGQHLASSLILKFASNHPVFATRQLELISVLLKGRMRSSWTAFKRDGHADLFKGVVRTLLRLTPAVFSHKRFPEIIQTVLETIKCFSSLTNELFKKIKADLFELIDQYFQFDYTAAKRALKAHAEFIAENPKRNRYLMNCLGILDSETNSAVSNSNLKNAAFVDISKSRKFFTGSVVLETSAEETLNQFKILEDLSHKQDPNILWMIEPLLCFLHSNLSCPEVVEKTLSVILSICKIRTEVSEKVAKELIQILMTGQNASEVTTIISSYTIDLLVVNCSDCGVELLKAIFDACLLTNFAEAENQLKKIIRATTLEKIFACTDL